ncbi:MAG: amidohydrolase family protein, partial [Clostridium sp.]
MCMRLFIKNIDTLVTCDDSDNVFKNVNILIENGVIKHIGKETFESDEIVDGKDMIVYPGLINTHHHLYQTFTRNLPEVQNMELFPWLKYLYEIWKGLDEESIRYSSMTGLSELLKCGCTTCFDHHYVFPENAGNTLIDTQFEVASR